MYSKCKIAGLTEGEGKVVYCEHTVGWMRLSGVRARLYGKHTMGEVIRSEGKAIRKATDGRGYTVLGVRVKAVR